VSKTGVINFESQKSQGKYQWQIDTQNLKAGVYYYTITFEDKSVTYKMAVIK
jgi:hypothetical protein